MTDKRIPTSGGPMGDALAKAGIEVMPATTLRCVKCASQWTVLIGVQEPGWWRCPKRCNYRTADPWRFYQPLAIHDLGATK